MTIKMYGADWCGDCRRAEKFYIDNNIEFQKINLELDEKEHFVESEVLRRNNGKKSIPVIVFDVDSSYFVNSDLTFVSFARAKLTNVDLTGADLTNADLTGADLTGANLKDTTLKDAKMPSGWTAP